MVSSRSLRILGQSGSAAVLLLLSVGCPTSPPPRRPEPKIVDDNEPRQTAEWLFVTAEGQPVHGKKAECEKVAGWVTGEKACTGALCIHARDLGKEWLAACTKLVPKQVDAVQQMVDDAKGRVELPDDDCVRQGDSLLRDPTCQDPASCTSQAQMWVSRCGERYATPLLVLMVTRTLERKFSDDTRIELDTRSCDTMGKQIAAAYGCDGDDKCRAPAETASAWLSRCTSAESGAPLILAFQAADALVGGGKGVDPIPVDGSSKALPEGTFPLQLEDNRGVVAWVCGSRPKDLKGYLAARKDCTRGELVISHLDKTQHMRTASVQHASDAEFVRLFPFLMVKGEQEARDLAALGAFTKALSDAAEDADSHHAERAYKKLAGAMMSKVWAMVRQPMYQKAIASMDARLEPAFKAWGKAKATAAGKIRKDDDFALFVGRALASPLNDMTSDGAVSPGAFATPTAFTLATWMPRSMHAYREALEQAEKRADRHRPTESRVTQLQNDMVSEMTACAAGLKEVSDAEQASADCLFGTEGCAEPKPAELSKAADAARQKAQAARMRLDAILDSGILSASELERADADRIGRGCLDP